MSCGDLSERLGAIDENIALVAHAELRYSDAMGQVYNYVEAVARDEVSLEIMGQNPDIDTGVDRDEISSAITDNRDSLLRHVEDAVSKRKDVLRALHQSELDRNQLFASKSDESGDLQ